MSERNVPLAFSAKLFSDVLCTFDRLKLHAFSSSSLADSIRRLATAVDNPAIAGVAFLSGRPVSLGAAGGTGKANNPFRSVAVIIRWLTPWPFAVDQ